MLYILILLGGVYIVDHYAFGGKMYDETSAAVGKLALQADYKIRDLLRPLGK